MKYDEERRSLLDVMSKMRCGKFYCAHCSSIVRGDAIRTHEPRFEAICHSPNQVWHAMFRVFRDSSASLNDQVSLAREAWKKFSARDQLGHIHGAFGALSRMHVSWYEGQAPRVRDRTGWHVHFHALLCVSSDAVPDMTLLNEYWSSALKASGGRGGSVKLSPQPGDVRKRLGYIHRGEAKFMAGLHRDDLKVLVGVIVSMRRLTETYGLLRGQ